MKIEVNNLAELSDVSEELIEFSNDIKVFAFYGEMGVGKTTFIKQLIQFLGGEETDSPTFSLVNECLLPGNNVAYHFDFYRINNESEALDMGIEEYLYSGNYCFIEWPQKIENLLPQIYVSVHIEENNHQRIFTIDKVS